MTSLIKEALPQREQCRELLNILEQLVNKTGYTPLTQKIVALCTVKLSDPLSLLNESHVEKQALIQKNWIITLIWVLKVESKVLREVDYPFCDPEFQFLEPLGRKIHADLLLWGDCLDVIDKFAVPLDLRFSSAVEAWYTTTQERMGCAYEGIFKKRTKTELIEYKQKELALLKKGENPHNPQGRQHLYNLIELAKTIRDPNPLDNNWLKRERREFRDLKWKAYIVAHQNWCQRLIQADELFYLAYVDGEKMKAILPGRQTKTLYPLPAKSFLKQTRKKSIANYPHPVSDSAV